MLPNKGNISLAYKLFSSNLKKSYKFKGYTFSRPLNLTLIVVLSNFVAYQTSIYISQTAAGKLSLHPYKTIKAEKGSDKKIKTTIKSSAYGGSHPKDYLIPLGPYISTLTLKSLNGVIPKRSTICTDLRGTALGKKLLAQLNS